MGLTLRINITDDDGKPYIEGSNIRLSDSVLDTARPDYKERAKVISTTELVLKELIKQAVDKWNVEHPPIASGGFKL